MRYDEPGLFYFVGQFPVVLYFIKHPILAHLGEPNVDCDLQQGIKK
jgi:hypothetical protein